MKTSTERLFNEIERFIGGSAAGFLQLLVAAAQRNTFRRIIGCPTYPAPVQSGGLGIAVRYFHEALENADVHVPTFLARLYASARPFEHRKRTGQFFAAAEVAEWALSLEAPQSNDDVCDAGVGTAVFADAILRSGHDVRSYTGVENDPVLILCAAHALESLNAPDSYKLWYAHFLLLRVAYFKQSGLEPPTLIIANPPFVRFHSLSGRARIRKHLKLSLGITLSSLSGSGNYFLSRAAELVHGGLISSALHGAAPSGRLLFFLPNEAAGAGHAKRLRHDLEQLHGWTYKQIKIPQQQTGIDRHPSNALALLFIFEQQKRIPTARVQCSSVSASVQDIIRIKRGISTGCNDFFVLTDSEVRSRRIPRRYLCGVLPTRIPITRSLISKTDWDLLRQANHACWLLSLPAGEIEDFEPSVQDYLKEGLRRGIHETPTARSFKKWFSISLPAEPPDLFVTYLFRGAPRFVLNRAQVFHLTNILGGRFIFPVSDPKRQEAIVEALNSLAHEWMKDGIIGREYKGGLLKVEPRELSMLRIDQQMLKLLGLGDVAKEPMPQLLFE